MLTTSISDKILTPIKCIINLSKECFGAIEDENSKINLLNILN